MIIKDWKKELFTIPNLLSMFRFLLIPVYIVIYLNAQGPADYYIAGGILAVSCLTDAIDGQIARRFNMITTLGKLIDPLADKATQVALLVCLAIRYPVIWIVAGLIVVKECFQMVAALIALKQGKMLDGALLIGKICTTVLFVSLILLVLIPTMPYTAVCIITAVDALLVFVTFLNYVKAFLTLILKTPSPKTEESN